jgi:hypothetical protein
MIIYRRKIIAYQLYAYQILLHDERIPELCEIRTDFLYVRVSV